jgi:hypothetical protein
MIQRAEVVGIFIADQDADCCICDEPLQRGEYIKRIGDRYASMPCVDKALVWFVNARDKKKEQAK